MSNAIQGVQTKPSFSRTQPRRRRRKVKGRPTASLQACAAEAPANACGLTRPSVHACERLFSPIAAQEFGHREIRDVARVDRRDTGRAYRHRIDAVPLDDLLYRESFCMKHAGRRMVAAMSSESIIRSIACLP
jgi:hypothetical protein